MARRVDLLQSWSLSELGVGDIEEVRAQAQHRKICRSEAAALAFEYGRWTSLGRLRSNISVLLQVLCV